MEKITMKESGVISVKVTKKSGTSWYNKHIGEIFSVYSKPVMYFGGLGYTCVCKHCGITISDCEVVQDA